MCLHPAASPNVGHCGPVQVRFCWQLRWPTRRQPERLMVSKSLLGQLGPDSSSCKAAATSIEAGSNTSGKSSALQANSMQVMQASGLAKNYVLVVKPVALVRRDEELAHQAQGQQLFGQPAQALPAGTLMLLHPTLTFLMAPASRPVTSGGL